MQAGLAFLGAIEGMYALLDKIASLDGASNPQMAALERFAAAARLELGPVSTYSWAEIALEASPLIVALTAAVAAWHFSRRGRNVGGD